MNKVRVLLWAAVLVVALLGIDVARDAGETASASAYPAQKYAFLFEPGIEPDDAAIRREIVEANRRMVETMKRGDLPGVARFYADDATILFHRGLKIQGRQGIDAYWTGIKGAKDWKLDVIEVGGNRDEAYQLGKSSFTSEVDGKVSTYTCDFVAVWKRQKDGALKIYVDIYN
ncbi:MAG: DUF4440 domain-containing protein [Acidobacteriota bacterium]|nr:DUF4440 domain-containing protein [Acidobacteriota bacterium]